MFLAYASGYQVLKQHHFVPAARDSLLIEPAHIRYFLVIDSPCFIGSSHADPMPRMRQFNVRWRDQARQVFANVQEVWQGVCRHRCRWRAAQDHRCKTQGSSTSRRSRTASQVTITASFNTSLHEIVIAGPASCLSRCHDGLRCRAIGQQKSESTRATKETVATTSIDGSNHGRLCC